VVRPRQKERRGVTEPNVRRPSDRQGNNVAPGKISLAPRKLDRMRTRLSITIVVLAALGLVSMPADAQRVLFIGNSLIGYNDMPALFQHLAASAGHKPSIEEFIWYGRTLKADEGRPDLQHALTTQKWDYVVLQEQSTFPLTDPDLFDASVAYFDEPAKAAGARTVLLENWAMQGEPTLPGLVAAYANANRNVNALIVPLAQAWDTVTSHSTINLYRDGKHPTPIATYMATCLVYGAIYHGLPDGLPHEGIDIIPKYPGGQYGGVPLQRQLIDLDKSAGADNVNYVQSVAVAVATQPVSAWRR